MAQGTVTRFYADKGYGFIAPDDGTPDVFVYQYAIEADGYHSLQDNQRVEYTVTRAPRACGPSTSARSETPPWTPGRRQQGIAARDPGQPAREGCAAARIPRWQRFPGSGSGLPDTEAECD